jgi:ribonucleotide monophosphatase NagD (HAD superfamily)
VPYRLVTNTTSKPRSAILTKMRDLGLELAPEAILTAPLIGRGYLLQRGLTRCYPLLKDSLREDLPGIEFVERSPQAVLVGDLGDELRYGALNRGFRFLLDPEVAFITLARNRYFRGSDGLCMDVGATVAALEYAAASVTCGRRVSWGRRGRAPISQACPPRRLGRCSLRPRVRWCRRRWKRWIGAGFAPLPAFI